MSIDLNEAKQHFIELMRSLNKTDQRKFLTFIVKEWQIDPHIFNNDTEDNMNEYKDDEKTDYPLFMLNSIISDIKQKVPFNAILPSEKITPPSSGLNSDCDPKITYHLDLFLYDEEDLTEFESNGQIQKYYCVDCESRNIQSLIYISHSISQEALSYIFNKHLPSLKDKTVLDVGSRLGAVLYGAYVYSEAKKIIGVEMNEDFCNLQKDIICKYKMEDRIFIFHNRIEEVSSIIQESDVIIMNNPFEFYLPQDVQINIWKFLKATIKAGTILVTCPAIEMTFRNLQVDFSVESWLKPLEKPYSHRFSPLNILSTNEYSEIISYYEVL